jgi:segregation and condensation protein B
VNEAPRLERLIEALLFLAPEPVSVQELVEATDATEAQVERALDGLEGTFADGARGLVLRNVAGGWTLAADPVAEEAARKLLSRPKTPPLTQAQAETLAIVAYLQPVSRPEISRIRGVSGESAVQTLGERGLIEESGRSRFGATIYRTTPLFERVFGLSGLDALPDPSRFDPTPEDEQDLRERLLKAGEQRAA